MKVFESISDLEGIGHGWAVTIGNFDGVHRGHQEILRRTGVAAHAAHAIGVAAITFDPHPMALLHPDRAPGILTPLPYRIGLLEQYGVDCLIILRDGLRVFNMSPKDFVDDLLVRRLGLKVIVEGGDFHFGYGRSGTVQTLREMGQTRGFSVVVVDPFVIRDAEGRPSVCSSSHIRDLLDDGAVRQAAEILGRPYRLMGRTVPGRGIGKQLGFPTANIHALEQIVPAEGVYAGFAIISETMDTLFGQTQRMPAVFASQQDVTDHPLLEAHPRSELATCTASGWRWISVECLAGNSGSIRQALAAQIAADCDKATDNHGNN
jgi:riboflavin kinase/FMN adenylyltransferase